MAAERLARAGIEAPRREARLLAAHALGVSATALLDARQEIDPTLLDAAIARRAAREPLAFITGRRGFWTLDLAVSPDTLVPRADSEALIEAALAAFPDRSAVCRILDLGTGTGCLLLAALAEFPLAFGVGVDLSPAAAALASRNSVACGQLARGAFLAGDWAASLVGRFDLILCNPPYIKSAAIAGLMPEVGGYEPRRALDGGAGGLDAYRRLMPALPPLLSPAGVAIFEVGEGQESDVVRLAAQAGLTHVTSRADLGGIARALVIGRGIRP